MKDKNKMKEQFVAESEYAKGSEFTLTLPLEYQSGKHYKLEKSITGN